MSSSATTSTPVVAIMDTPRPRRPYQIIVLVDKDTRRAIERRQGTGTRKLSKSEVAYRLLTAALAAEDGDRRSGEDRRATEAGAA